MPDFHWSPSTRLLQAPSQTLCPWRQWTRSLSSACNWHKEDPRRGFNKSTNSCGNGPACLLLPPPLFWFAYDMPPLAFSRRATFHARRNSNILQNKSKDDSRGSDPCKNLSNTNLNLTDVCTACLGLAPGMSHNNHSHSSNCGLRRLGSCLDSGSKFAEVCFESLILDKSCLL